jgi:hypothetical protein
MTVVAGLKCNVWLAGSQYYGVIDIWLQSALLWLLGTASRWIMAPSPSTTVEHRMRCCVSRHRQYMLGC